MNLQVTNLYIWGELLWLLYRNQFWEDWKKRSSVNIQFPIVNCKRCLSVEFRFRVYILMCLKHTAFRKIICKNFLAKFLIKGESYYSLDKDLSFIEFGENSLILWRLKNIIHLSVSHKLSGWNLVFKFKLTKQKSCNFKGYDTNLTYLIGRTST